MSKVISHVTVKQEMYVLPSSSEGSALDSGESMISDNGRKRDRTAGKMEDTRITKRQKGIENSCHSMIHDGSTKDFSELVKVELKEPGAPMLSIDLQENSNNVFCSQSSESDDESDDEFDPWAEIFANTYDSSCGQERELTSPRSCVKRGGLTWEERFLSSV